MRIHNEKTNSVDNSEPAGTITAITDCAEQPMRERHLADSEEGDTILEEQS